MQRFCWFFISMASTPLGEFIRLPFLIHHCFVHFQEDGNMDFVDFLKMHYASGPLVDEDFHKDMQRPSKHFM
ncbi:MAG: hypothetical protein IPN29_00370 [Saprospiraceae bacterium]|nr:hypothetical protein [Saprospiraceae bacterium]